MRNIFVAFALSVLSLSAFAGVNFDRWHVNNSADLMSVQVLDKGGDLASVGVHKNGTVAFTGAPFGYVADHKAKLVKATDGVLRVNGVNVKFNVEVYDDGFVYATTATNKGNNYICDQLWKSSHINVVFPDGEVINFSARGVQKAWRYMQANEAI